MLDVLANQTYRRLFAAQVVALLGTGLATVALGLLAYDLAGGNAALVLGTIFTIKMVAYVVIAPIAGALADRADRRRLLVALDIVRAGATCCLPFVSDVWQIYLLIFALQSASAAFTPVFQATIPDILPDEAEYTRALSLSRLAYDIENIASPTLAALLLALISYQSLFFGTVAGFALSAILVASVSLPPQPPSNTTGFYDRSTKGMRIYLRTPRLRGLLALNLAAAAGGAMVLVNSVLLVRGTLGLNEQAVAWAMFAFGSGSMTAALCLPRILDRYSDRWIMIRGAIGLTLSLVVLALVIIFSNLSWPFLLTAWVFAGFGYSTILTPVGRLLRRSAHVADRPAIFAAQFALSHACWLLTYPLAGALMTFGGPVVALAGLALLAASGTILGARLWPVQVSAELAHEHDALPRDHPHILEHGGNRHHAHPVVIDELHPTWPDKAL